MSQDALRIPSHCCDTRRTQPPLCQGIYGSKEPRALVQADADHDEQAMPIRVILHQHEVPVDVYWAP